MATITKPPILDETGQDIALKINALTAQITALYQLLADLGLATLAPISQADYDALSPTEQLAGCFDIYDAPNLNIDGDSVSYDSNTSIKQAVDLKANKSESAIVKTGGLVSGANVITGITVKSGTIIFVGRDSLSISSIAFVDNAGAVRTMVSNGSTVTYSISNGTLTITNPTQSALQYSILVI